MYQITLNKNQKNITLKKIQKSVTLKKLEQSIKLYQTGRRGPKGADSDKNYTQSFTNSAEVTVTHNLGKLPAVTIQDSTGDEVEGDIQHVSINQLIARFSASFSGTIACN